uniref:BTB domain-containing protein n=1 Tax=Strongyloides papillosus TaxID=174720 RepID=A0A0N5C010_STREA
MCSIEKFPLRTEKTGERVTSRTFIIGCKNRSEWYLEIYPNGHNSDSKDYVSVFLMLKKPDKASAKFRFSILNDKKGEKNSITFSNVRDFVKNMRLGSPRFVRKDFLLNDSNGLLINDKLTILCEIEIIDVKSEYHNNPKTSINATIPQSKSLLNYGKMLNSSLYSDCIIKVKDTEIKVHKVVLAAQSPIFSNILKSKLEESGTNVIEIENFRVEVVREMVKYIYTDEVSDIQNMANEVLEIADKYGLDRLKAISAQYLCRNLTIKNVCERFALSEKCSIQSLKECCMEFIIENDECLMETKEWKEFVLIHPLLLESLFLKALNISLTESISEKK